MGEGHNFKMSNSTQTEKRGGYRINQCLSENHKAIFFKAKGGTSF
jgi:hypothetical protein